MDAGGPDPALVGRDPELGLLEEFVGSSSAHGGVLVLAGEPGTGKSRLVQHAWLWACEREFLGLRVSGIQAESRLPFAGLHQLLAPLLHRAVTLPAPQRTALTTALGLAAGPSPSIFLTGLATLTLLTDAAAERPVVLLTDDLHWLDDPTQTVLAFVARRLGSDPVSLIASVRSGVEHRLVDVPAHVLVVGPLEEAASERVLELTAGDLSELAQRAILDASEGNPLALVELPKAWRAARSTSRGAGIEFPTGMPMTKRLQAAFSGRAHALPDDTRDLLLTAAVSDSESLTEILQAARELAGEPVTADVADPAVAAGLVAYDLSDFHFRHPLVRSGVLASECVGRRLRASAAWAVALRHQPHRAVWFRAASATAPDEDLAQSLLGAAAASAGIGAVNDAVRAMELAAQLTPEPRERAHRLLVAAEQAFGLGRADLVERMVSQAAPSVLSEVDRARVTWLGELFHDGDPADGLRVAEMVDSARRAAAAGDPDLAQKLLYGAAVRCWWSGAGPEVRRAVAAALSFAGNQHDTQVLAALAVAEPLESGAAVTRVLEDPPDLAPEDADGLCDLGRAAWAIGDSPRCVDLLDRAAVVMRAQGRLGVLVHALSMQANARVTLGEWQRAEFGALEAERLARETHQPIWAMGSRSVAAMLAGIKGQRRAELEVGGEAEAYARSRGLADQLACITLARAFIHAGRGRFEESCDELLQAFDPGSPRHHERESLHGLMVLAETAVHVGRIAEARDVVARMEDLAERTPSPLLHMHLLYARPVLSDRSQAEELFVRGLAEDLTRWPWVRARLQLAFGIWLRRERRVVESRSPLQSAALTLNELAATHWAQRAQRELRASGARVEPQTRPASSLLSGQELQIARLAARGFSNKEIGDQLFVSARTVASHLYHVFPKLQVTSRTQLAARLGLLQGEASPVADDPLEGSSDLREA